MTLAPYLPIFIHQFCRVTNNCGGACSWFPYVVALAIVLLRTRECDIPYCSKRGTATRAPNGPSVNQLQVLDTLGEIFVRLINMASRQGGARMQTDMRSGESEKSWLNLRTALHSTGQEFDKDGTITVLSANVCAEKWKSMC